MTDTPHVIHNGRTLLTHDTVLEGLGLQCGQIVDDATAENVRQANFVAGGQWTQEEIGSVAGLVIDMNRLPPFSAPAARIRVRYPDGREEAVIVSTEPVSLPAGTEVLAYAPPDLLNNECIVGLSKD